MKTSILTSMILLFIIPLSKAQNADEIFQKVIDYYDPEGKWDEFRGEMTIYVLKDDLKSPDAIKHDIILDNKRNVYQTTRYKNDSLITVGLDNDAAFFLANNKKVDPEVLDWGQQEQGVRMFEEHHRFHFSLPLSLHAAGATPTLGESIKFFNNEEVYVLKFDGLPNRYDKGWFNGPVELYIDPETFALVGSYWDIDFAGGLINQYLGEIELDGIKVPHMKVYHNVGSGEYRQTDIFYPGLLYDEFSFAAK